MFRSICRKMLIYCLVGFCLFLAAGCERSDQSEQTPAPTSLSRAPELSVGLIPEQNIFNQLARYKPLMDYLSEETGIIFHLKVLPRYNNLIDNFNDLHLDAAFFGSFTGAMAIHKLGVVPLARPQFIGGRSTYYGMVFVRKNSGIKTAEDMKGKTVVFVDRATTAGYLLPLAYFHKIGITNIAQWFKESYFSGTHEDAILEVLNGYADIGAAKNTVFQRMALTNPRITQELEILATSPHVPANGLAVRKDLPEELRISINKTLLNMDQNQKGRTVLKEFGADKFLVTTQEDYLPVLNYAANIGLDLATYNYHND